MSFSVFDPKTSGSYLRQPMFFGPTPSLARYEQQKYPEFERFSEKQISYFWRPEEVILTQDRADFLDFARHERHIFVSNLEYQITMDSVQGRAPVLVLTPCVSLPELEHWNTNWQFSENIHSRSYTHMIRNIMTDSSATFDSIMGKPEIQARARDVGRYYDYLHGMNVKRDITELLGERNANTGAIAYHEANHRRALVMCLYSINALEAIRFYASFACTFLFKEHGRMGGSAKIMQLIARDEALHHSATNTMLQILGSGEEGDEWAREIEDCKPEAQEMFGEIVQQELDWADYLFQYGSMLGMNADVLKAYVRDVAAQRMEAIGLRPLNARAATPVLPWMSTYLESKNTQNTPQEAENSAYLINQVSQDIDEDFLAGLEDMD